MLRPTCKMTFAFFAGRSTLRRLHQTVQRNLHKQHQRNESTKSKHSSKTNPGGGGGGGDVPHTTPPSSGSYYAWLEPIKFPFRAYSSMQARSPLTVQLESSLIIYFLGDLSAQFVQTSSFTEGRYEPIRGLRAMVIGGISSIPSYKWFMWLGRNFNYDKHWKGLVVKIVVSQTLFTPIFNTYFFGMQTLLAGGTWKETVDRVCRTVPVSWVNSVSTLSISLERLNPQEVTDYCGADFFGDSGNCGLLLRLSVLLLYRRRTAIFSRVSLPLDGRRICLG